VCSSDLGESCSTLCSGNIAMCSASHGVTALRWTH
jgi:hypothetical protein